MSIRSLAIAALSLVTTTLVWAQSQDPCAISPTACAPNRVPEPETLALLAVAGVVGYLVRRKNRK